MINTSLASYHRMLLVLDANRCLVDHNPDLHDIWLPVGVELNDEMIEFINTQTKGYFFAGRTMVGFAEEQDALFFKLRWS